MSIYLDFAPNDFNPSSQLSITGDNAHYLINVLRKKTGNNIAVYNGKGSMLETKILNTNKKTVLLEVLKVNFFPASSLNFVLGISVLKNPNRLEWLFEKATELGINGIIPFVSEHSEKKFFKPERFKNILVAAMFQSQQYHLPQLFQLMSINEIIDLKFFTKKYFAHCSSAYPKTEINKLSFNEDALFLIGPEGDFSEKEITQLSQQNFIPISLGNNRLRSETAGMFVCTHFYNHKNKNLNHA